MNMTINKILKTALFFPLCIPSIISFILFNKKRKIVMLDLKKQSLDGKRILKNNLMGGAFFFGLFLVHQKSFRAVYYKRMGFISPLLNFFLPQIDSCEIYGSKIGGGLRIYHGFNIIINPKAIIGENCDIHHEVTIGATELGVPIIGNNVFIGAGAKIIGLIKIGNNVKIGAGAIVVNDIPDNSVVVGEKAHVIIK